MIFNQFFRSLKDLLLCMSKFYFICEIEVGQNFWFQGHFAYLRAMLVNVNCSSLGLLSFIALTITS